MDRDECAKDLAEVLHSLLFEEKASRLKLMELKGSKDKLGQFGQHVVFYIYPQKRML